MTTLPILTGSEKQIAWANKIRAEKISKWNDLIAETGASKRERQQTLARVMREIADILTPLTDASAWIDGRDNTSVMLMIAGTPGQDRRAKFGADRADIDYALSLMN